MQGELRMRSLFFILLSTLAAVAQSGGQYEIESSMIASGGTSSGGQFDFGEAIGQTLAGNRSQGGPFSVQSGFWVSNLAPTAAQVSISGRVLTAGGYAIRNARVVITALNGETRAGQTGSLGYFRFEGVGVGSTYVLTVSSDRFAFDRPSMVVTVMDELTDLDFIANP